MSINLSLSVLLCAWVLTGCSGGGGGGQTEGPSAPPPPPMQQSILDEFTRPLEDESMSAAIMARAATNSPRPGSVTQSSNGNGETLDSVSVVTSENDDGSDRFVVTNMEGAQWSIDSNTAEVRGRWSGTEGAGLTLHKADAEGTLHLAVARWTDDADHVAFGYWLYYPANTDPIPIVGAFVDVNDPFTQTNLAALTGTAVYTADATAVGHFRRGSRAAVAEIEAIVTLTARFGDASELGTIGGGLNVTHNSLDPEGDEGDQEEELRFEPAMIGSSNSGFFTGNVTYVGNDDEVTGGSGKWGGQFVGNPRAGSANPYPDGVFGTFGGHLTYDDGAASFMGVFGTLDPADTTP